MSAWSSKKSEKKAAAPAAAPGAFSFKRTGQSSALRARLQQAKEHKRSGSLSSSDEKGSPVLGRTGSLSAVTTKSSPVVHEEEPPPVPTKSAAQLKEEREKKQKYLQSIIADATADGVNPTHVEIRPSAAEEAKPSVKLDLNPTQTIPAASPRSMKRGASSPRKKKGNVSPKRHSTLSPRVTGLTASPRMTGLASPTMLRAGGSSTASIRMVGGSDTQDDELVTWLPMRFEKGFKPPPMQLFSLCVTQKNELVLFGGCDEDMQKFSNDVYTVGLDAENKKWQRPTCSGKQPPPLAACASVRVSANVMLVIGGLYETSPTNDVWVLKLDTMAWSRAKTTGDGPPAIFGHSATFVNMSGTPSVLVFGGCKGPANETNGSIYLLDTTKMKWMKSDLPGAPSGRYYHSAIAINEQVFVFGGTQDGEDSTNDFFCLDTKRYSWFRMSTLGGPSARMKQVCTELHGDLIIHGGMDGAKQPRKDCYRYSIKDKAWKEVQYNGMSATERSGHGCVSMDSTVIVCGGAPFSATLDIHAFVEGVKETGDVRAKPKMENPQIEQQQKKLEELQQNMDYKKKYYEIYSIFLELQEISNRKLKTEGEEEGNTADELLDLLQKKIEKGFEKLNKTHEEQQRRVMDVAQLASQMAEQKKAMEPKVKKKRSRRSMYLAGGELLNFDKRSSSPDMSARDEIPTPSPPPPELTPEELAKKEEEEKRKKEEEEEEKRRYAEMIANETPQEKQMRFRKKVLEELLATEEDHVRDLNIIMSVFVEGQHNLNPHEVLSLFGNLESILPVNRQLLEGLRAVMDKPPEEQRVGILFQEIADYLKMYAAYCAQQNKSLDTLTLLRKHNPAFAVFLQMCQADSRCRKLDLESFLIKPMQRICRYPLLLKELWKQTPETHVDYEELRTALEKVQDVVGIVNEKKRECENQEQVMTIQLSMVWQGDPYFLATPTRRFIKSESAFRFEGGKKSKIEIMLFNDLVLLAKRKGEKLYEKAVIDINNCILWNLKDPPCAFCVRRSDDKHHVFNIVVSSEAAKAEWMELITSSITKVMFKDGERLAGKKLDELTGKA